MFSGDNFPTTLNMQPPLPACGVYSNQHSLKKKCIISYLNSLVSGHSRCTQDEPEMGSLISWNVKISVSMLIFYWSTDYFNIHPRSRKVREKYSKLKAKKFCIEPMRNTESSNSVRFNSDHCEYRDKAILN